MLHKLKDLIGYKLLGLDGEIGKVKEFYFDDRHWTVRYLVVDTGNWLSERAVLISPYALDRVIKQSQDLAVNLTKKQIEESPSLDSEKPVSKHFEESYYDYYGWPTYWASSYMWGVYPNIMREPELWKKNHHDESPWDPNLRSTHYVKGHRIEALDGEIGHIDDFIIDDETWAIQYLVVDTRNWWPGKKVLISSKWIEEVSWDESKVFLNLTRARIKQSAEFNENSLSPRNDELGMSPPV